MIIKVYTYIYIYIYIHTYIHTSYECYAVLCYDMLLYAIPCYIVQSELEISRKHEEKLATSRKNPKQRERINRVPCACKAFCTGPTRLGYLESIIVAFRGHGFHSLFVLYRYIYIYIYIYTHIYIYIYIYIHIYIYIYRERERFVFTVLFSATCLSCLFRAQAECYTYVRTYIHTCIHACIHTYIHTCYAVLR